MSTSAKLRDALGNRLLAIVATDEELQPAMVSACVNFLKAFPLLMTQKIYQWLGRFLLVLRSTRP